MLRARVTSVPAAYRPLGIYASSNVLDAPLPAGSDVYATIYIASVLTSVIRPTGVLMATDREIGNGQGLFTPVLGIGPGPGYNAQGNELPDGGACAALGELCWTKFDLAFKTTRPAFTGEQLTFQIQLLGAQGWAFGHEAGHASKVAIVAAPMPPTGLEFGVTIDQPAAGSRVNSGSTVIAGGRATFPDLGSDPDGAGDHPSENYVEISLDDASFAHATTADLDEASGTLECRARRPGQRRPHPPRPCPHGLDDLGRRVGDVQRRPRHSCRMADREEELGAGRDGLAHRQRRH